jgi:hypothetical protein
MTAVRAPRKSLTAGQLKRARDEIARTAPTLAFDIREFKAMKKHANWLSHRVVLLEFALNQDMRYSKRVVRKILEFAGDPSLV